jgi:hypothetical protein
VVVQYYPTIRGATLESTKRMAWLVWRPDAGGSSEQHPEFLGLYPSMDTAAFDIALLREKTGTEWYAVCVPFVGWGIQKWNAEIPSPRINDVADLSVPDLSKRT